MTSKQKIEELSKKDLNLIIEKFDEKKDYLTSFVYTYYAFKTTNHTSFITNIGYHYDMGLGVKVDKKKAIYYYKLAIDRKSPQAMINLASCYGTGDGVNKDINKQLELLIKSYEINAKKLTLNEISLLLSKHGNNLAIDIDEKIKWYKLYLDSEDYNTKYCNKLVKLYEQKIKNLKTQLYYTPGEKGYNEAKKDFETKLESIPTNPPDSTEAVDKLIT